MGQRMELGGREGEGAWIQQIWAQWPHRMQEAKKLRSFPSSSFGKNKPWHFSFEKPSLEPWFPSPFTMSCWGWTCSLLLADHWGIHLGFSELLHMLRVGFFYSFALQVHSHILPLGLCKGPAAPGNAPTSCVLLQCSPRGFSKSKTK